MSDKRRRSLEHLRLLSVFAMLGAIMFISDMLMEFLRNIHIVGVLTVVYTAVYRAKALIPIYIYVFLNGVFSGFGVWWIAYLYIWTVLWAVVMLVPIRINFNSRVIIYIVAVTLHGLLFGILYMPVQAIFDSDIHYLVSWWVSGFIYSDIYHALGNCIFGILLIPVLIPLLIKLENKMKIE